jgi:hypothetical protein
MRPDSAVFHWFDALGRIGIYSGDVLRSIGHSGFVGNVGGRSTVSLQFVARAPIFDRRSLRLSSVTRFFKIFSLHQPLSPVSDTRFPRFTHRLVPQTRVPASKAGESPGTRRTVRIWDWVRFCHAGRAVGEAGWTSLGSERNFVIDGNWKNAAVPNEPSPISGHSLHPTARMQAPGLEGSATRHASWLVSGK